MSFSQLSFAAVQGKQCCLAVHLPASGCDLRVSPAFKSDGAESSPPGLGKLRHERRLAPKPPSKQKRCEGRVLAQAPRAPPGCDHHPATAATCLSRDGPLELQAEPALPLPELAGPAGLSA